MKNVTVPKFELAFTRCRNDLKTAGNLTVIVSLQDFDAIERYLHPKCRSVLFQKASKIVLFSSFSSVYTMLFPMCWLEFSFLNLPFSKCAGKNMPFSCEREAISHIFHRFQNVPASCERGLS